MILGHHSCGWWCWCTWRCGCWSKVGEDVLEIVDLDFNCARWCWWWWWWSDVFEDEEDVFVLDEVDVNVVLM